MHRQQMPPPTPASGPPSQSQQEQPSQRPSQQQQQQQQQQRTSAPPSSSPSSLFAIPRPLKVLFDAVPLHTYPANELPARSPRRRDRHALYVFTTEQGAREGAPSYNPGCLKWQTYLKFLSIDFYTLASNNHASPSGALPFLLPGLKEDTVPTSSSAQPSPVTTNKMHKWCLSLKGEENVEDEPDDMRYEAYMSLLDHRIRRAWLQSLYLSPNFSSLATPLYITPLSSHPLIRLGTSLSLRRAAAESISSTAPGTSHSIAPILDAEMIYKEADEAFEALDTLLGENEWFFGKKNPGLFDAAVFAYTCLIGEGGIERAFGRKEGEEGPKWCENVLGELLGKRKGLVRHREKILEGWY